MAFHPNPRRRSGRGNARGMLCTERPALDGTGGGVVAAGSGLAVHPLAVRLGVPVRPVGHRRRAVARVGLLVDRAHETWLARNERVAEAGAGQGGEPGGRVAGIAGRLDLAAELGEVDDDRDALLAA